MEGSRAGDRRRTERRRLGSGGGSGGGRRGQGWELGDGFAHGLVDISFLGRLVANEAHYAPHNVADDGLLWRGLYEPRACTLDGVEELIDVVPFRLGYDLAEDVGSGFGAVVAGDLSALEEAVTSLGLAVEGGNGGRETDWM